MTATAIGFRWLDILEKEFDKSFVDLDLILGKYSLIVKFHHTNNNDVKNDFYTILIKIIQFFNVFYFTLKGMLKM